MSLSPLLAMQPFGQFDSVDTELTSFKGGEVCTLMYLSTTGTDEAAKDVFDGYIQSGSATYFRPAVTKTFVNSGSAIPAAGSAADGYSRPLMLSDDGIYGYGTLLGSVVGGCVGQVSYGANTVPSTQIGPSSATGSGKITCWAQAGLYAVSLDAVDAAGTTVSGLQPTNQNLKGGDPLGFTTSGLLAPIASATGTLVYEGAASNYVTVGHLVDFNTNGSLVSTQAGLCAGLNSPSGNVTTSYAKSLKFATIWFDPSLA